MLSSFFLILFYSRLSSSINAEYDYLRISGRIEKQRIPPSHTYNCSPEEALQISSKFRKQSYKNDRSNCPTEDWLEAISHHNFPQKGTVFINVGVNKGYNFALFMNLFASDTGISQPVWRDALVTQFNLSGICTALT